MRRCAGVRALLRRNGLGAAPRRLRGGGDAAATRFRRGGKRGLLAIALPGWEGRTGRAVSACVAASVCDAQGVELRCASAQERAALQTIMEDKIKAHTHPRSHAPTYSRKIRAILSVPPSAGALRACAVLPAADAGGSATAGAGARQLWAQHRSGWASRVGVLCLVRKVPVASGMLDMAC